MARTREETSLAARHTGHYVLLAEPVLVAPTRVFWRQETVDGFFSSLFVHHITDITTVICQVFYQLTNHRLYRRFRFICQYVYFFLCLFVKGLLWL